MIRLIALSASLLLLLSACVPASSRSSTDPANTVIIVNGPSEDAVAGLADELERRLLDQPGCCGFDLHWSVPVRAQENQRDLNGYRAWGSSGRIARSLGAGWAVLVGLNDFERTVNYRGDTLAISVTAGVIVHVLDSSANEIASFESGTRRAWRSQSADEPLADERREPLRGQIAFAALGDVLAPLTSELDWVTGNSSAQRK